jgi:ABC-type nitrate/sulfonate/bicarbonate transport system permease component
MSAPAVRSAASPTALDRAPVVAPLASLFRSDPVVKLVAGIILLAIWEICARTFAPPFVARPLNIFAAMPRVFANDAFWAAAWSSLGAVLVGLVIALVAGTLVGLAIGRVRTAERMLGIYVSSFFTMPMIAVLPLLTVWFGYNEEARLATIVFAALFSVIINVGDGARSVPHEYLEVGRAYRARTRDIWFDITLLSALPYLIAGVRLAAGRTLVGTVLAEIYASINGMGMFILANARGLRQNEAIVGVLLLAAVGLAFEWLMNWVLRRYFPWYRREGRE